MSSRRNILYFFIFTLLFWTIGPLMVYLIDPYHIFHETRWNKNLWFGSQPLINLGQIETYFKRSNDYDSILVGSSHTMNFKGSDLVKAVGAKGMLKLCNGGQSLQMKLMWLRKGLATEKVKHCFVEIDAFRSLLDSGIDSSLEAAKPYINHPYLCLFNLKTICSLAAFYCITHRFVSQHNSHFWTWNNLNEVHSWFPYCSQSFGYFAKHCQYLQSVYKLNTYSTTQRINESTNQQHYIACHPRKSIGQVLYLINT
ncbi:MAG: hypothetical protein MJ218_02140 [Opitutales bacterium]|nr:hypothetical protein [Opitutales bacterium]